MFIPSQSASQSVIMSTNSITSAADKQHELRKRHAIDKNGKEGNNVKNEILSAEMLAPLPQANISRVSSTIDLNINNNDETEALLKVKNELYHHLFIHLYTLCLIAYY